MRHREIFVKVHHTFVDKSQIIQLTRWRLPANLDN